MEESIGFGRFHRYVIEPHHEGVYLFVFETEDSSYPDKDYLEDTKSTVKEICRDEYGVPLSSWTPFDGNSLR